MKRFIIAAGLLASFGAAILASPRAQAQDGPGASNGAAFYAATCAGCHGEDGAKGLKGKSAEFVANALNGYRAKTFGGAKKEIMEERVAQLSDVQIRTLAQTIAAF